jgi:hypothetical protein
LGCKMVMSVRRRLEAIGGFHRRSQGQPVDAKRAFPVQPLLDDAGAHLGEPLPPLQPVRGHAGSRVHGSRGDLRCEGWVRG